MMMFVSFISHHVNFFVNLGPIVDDGKSLIGRIVRPYLLFSIIKLTYLFFLKGLSEIACSLVP